jgi:alpha-N-arabinofuranosidase
MSERAAIQVDVATVVRDTERRVIGINTNFMTDHAVIRQAGQGYEHALRQMGVRSLRYPGGEKSDEYFWSAPPWTSAQPMLALTGPQGRLSPMVDYVVEFTTFRYKPLDFDEFMGLCQRLDAEPIVCVNFDSMYLSSASGKGTPPTKAQLLEHAVEWVRYANVVRGYGVRYWELGNESYLRGGNGSARAADYARDFVEFARAMKAVDPTIQIGANGPAHKDDVAWKDGEDGPIWWQTVIETAGPEIGFLAVHPYPCWTWGSYDYYIAHNENLARPVDEACAALEAWARREDAERIRVFSTETNAADWAASAQHYPDLEGWPLVNDLGHALVLFDILGQHLLHPKVDMAEVWNTRWVHPARKELWNALGENNELNATGMAIAMWGRHLKAGMVAATSADAVRAFASHDPDTHELAVFLINKERAPQEVSLALQHYLPAWEETRYLLTGTGSEDQAPRMGQAEHLSGEGGSLHLTLEPVSVSAVELRPVS